MMRVAKMLNNGKAHKPALKGRPQHQRNVLSLGVTKWLVNGLTITLLCACLHSGTCQDFSGLSSRRDWWWPSLPDNNPQTHFVATEIKVLAINETARRAERNTNDIAATTLRSRYPLTGDEIRYQVVVLGPGGWYTRGKYNPRRLRDTYFDSRGWVVVAWGSLEILGSPTEEVPPHVYKFDSDRRVSLRFIDVFHVAIYLGIGGAIAGSNGGVIFPKVVESVGFNGNGTLDSNENRVRVATLSNPSAYHVRRLPLQR